MKQWPRITIVTPSYNQGKFIAETIDSVVVQNYPNLEHIVMDGGSTDDTLEILKRYPHLKIVSAPDRGQADAINKGFALATGDIGAFLNSDDTFLPGALQRVAAEIDPAQGRHVVMGRCRFIDVHGRYGGIEHPSYFESHQRVLEVWKGHMIPQPAVFWTSAAWNKTGGMDLNLKYHLDYDLFCRMSKHYRFHMIDQVLATYRLHAESKTEAWGEAERMADSIRLSRRYWGSRRSLMYWQLALSLAVYRFDRLGRARRLHWKAQDQRRHHQPLAAASSEVVAGLLAPKVVFYMGVYPYLKDHAKGTSQRLLNRLARPRHKSPQTAVYLERTTAWDDGWVGPKLQVTRVVGPEAQTVLVRGEVDFRFMAAPLSLALRVDGGEVGQQQIQQGGTFCAKWMLEHPLSPGSHQFEISANTWFVHHDFTGSGDYRPLVWRVAPQDALVLCSRGEPIFYVDHAAHTPMPDRLVFKSGWHQAEINGLDWVRWSAGRSEIVVIADVAKDALLWSELYSLQIPNEVQINVNGQPISKLEVAWEGFAPFGPIKLRLRPGENHIEIISRNLPLTTPTDSRPLAVAVKNLCFEQHPQQQGLS